MDEDLPEDERAYDPWSEGCTGPWPREMYEGTGIGALYGISPMTAEQAVSLKGWTARPRGLARREQVEGWDYEPRTDG